MERCYETSWFTDVPAAPLKEGFVLKRAFDIDTFEDKVDLSIGTYRDMGGKPWVLPVVRATEKALAHDETLTKEYLPTLGMESFRNAAIRVLLGEDSPAILQDRVLGIQCLSGSGGLRMGAEFLVRVLGKQIFYLSSPTWGSHSLIFTCAGFVEEREYRYWDDRTKSIDINGLLEDLANAPEHSVIILQACAHNPTGCDPTMEQWKRIAEVIRKGRLFPFFDCAYQGYASGDLDKDAAVVRYFVEEGFEFFCSQSFSQNFGIYSELIGNLSIIVDDPDMIMPLKSQFAVIVRSMYADPPSHGAGIVAYILNNPVSYGQWQQNIKTMAARIYEMRKQLRYALENLGTPGDWSHLTKQIGMFCYTGLTKLQSQHMLKKHHIYMVRSGNINITGLTPQNVEYIAKALHDTVLTLPTRL
ncbi:hypothetical protein JTB14_029426 [Gonioctena quinquepunctata]|nr:hypothetical protein JTB14_029426 [Gonioctena quinquepunctata]